MIIVITHREYNESKDMYETIVSHGIDMITGELVVMSQIPIEWYTGTTYNTDLQEYVMVK